MNSIILAAINARYTHSSFGLRYIYANLKELQARTEIHEFIKKEDVKVIAEKILLRNPRIVGIGVYIWNALEVSELIGLLKTRSKNITIVLGGPEVSHFPLRVNFDSADYIIKGEGDLEFYRISRQILTQSFPEQRVLRAELPSIHELKLPYKYYSDEDIKNRVIYVEASRGCPFSCQFCLSSIDKTVRKFDPKLLFSEFDTLWERGARHFKFVDRTFNLNIKYTNQILNYFLNKEPEYFLHFEVIPDYFPESLKEKLKLFPKASIQLEVGIQTLNEEVAIRINRNLNIKKIEKNIRFLTSETNAHLHLDLIIGLPGESLQSFEYNLNRLVSLTNSEIQLGLLKKLSGTSIDQHDIEFEMVYSIEPPYEIICNALISEDEMILMKRFARFWDLFYNSGNFKISVKYLWKDGEVFNSFYEFSNWIYIQLKRTWSIPLNRLTELFFIYLTEVKGENKKEYAEFIIRDFTAVPNRRIPYFLKQHAPGFSSKYSNKISSKNKRQIKHL